jgi:hypothetical protein
MMGTFWNGLYFLQKFESGDNNYLMSLENEEKHDFVYHSLY